MSYKSIRQDQEGFKFDDEFARVPRAMLHVLPECPYNHRQIIKTCVEKGWLKVVANVPETELMWGELQR